MPQTKNLLSIMQESFEKIIAADVTVGVLVAGVAACAYYYTAYKTTNTTTSPTSKLSPLQRVTMLNEIITHMKAVLMQMAQIERKKCHDAETIGKVLDENQLV